MSLQAEKVFEALGISEEPRIGSQYHVRCPAHDDQKASLSVLVDEGNITLQCHAGCSYEEVLEVSGLERGDMHLGPEPVTVERLAADKGLPVEFLYELGLKTIGDEVRIPYRKYDGEPAARQRRRLSLRASGDGSRWSAGHGSPVCYGDWRLKDDNHPYQIFVEGESDCWTLWYHGLPAIGIPGAKQPKLITRRHLKGKDRIYIWQEPDAGGVSFRDGTINQLCELGYEGAVYSIRGLDGEKDPNDLHKRSRDFLAAWEEILGEAKPEELTRRNVVALDSERGGIQVADGHYRKWKRDKVTDSWIPVKLSNFILEIAEVLILEDGSVEWAVDIHGANLKGTRRQRLESRHLATKRSFAEWLPLGLTWYGTNGDIDLLRDYLGRQARDAVTKRGVSRWGRHGDFLVYPNSIFDRDGRVEDPPVRLVSPGDETWLREPQDTEWDPSEAERIADSLTRFNTDDVVALALGWTFATPWRQVFGKFPQFSLASGAGSGKTSTALLMANLGGNMIEETASAQQTKFVVTRQMASTTTLPITLDEFKPNEMQDWTLRRLQDLLRLNYDASLAGRGRADQSVVNYQLTAPVILLGEGTRDQTAIVDRIVRPKRSRSRLEESQDYQEAYGHLRASNLGMFALAYQRWALSQTADLESIQIPELGGSLRAAHNHRVVKFGWLMLEKFCREVVGVPLPEIDIDRALVASMENLGYLETRDGKIRPKSTRSDVDILMEAIHDAIVNGLLHPGVHWVRRPQKGDVIIRIGSVLGKLQSTGVRLMDQADYRRIIREGDCPYAEWSDKKQADFTRQDPTHGTMRTKGPLVIDPVKLAEETDIPVALWEGELAMVSEAERLESSQ